jgi:SsrA-binding protein
MREKIISLNRRAYHDYNVVDSLETGIVLSGTEIKSIREGKITLQHAYAKPEGGELWLYNVHIAPYDKGNRYNHPVDRPRKLLLHREEINRLIGKVAEKGFTLVPLRVYLKNGLAKIELGLGKGKRIYDKRRSIIERETEREMERAMKRYHP